jgi:uncharacterized membrane protein YeaQ/YmgE (transglycosylase-associated protein family)
MAHRPTVKTQLFQGRRVGESRSLTCLEVRMDILTWLIVGLVAGVLASVAIGGIGYGILGDIVVGIVGAVIGGWLFAHFGWHTPFGGIAGVIFVAFIGAVVLLLILRALRPRGV